MSCEVDSVLQPLRTPERRRSARWEPDAAEAGALSLQDFQVLGVLGVGTYGVVKLARHRASGACVALKVLSKEQVVMLRQEKHILRERRVHAALRHPFVARLYGAFQDRDCLYLVLEYLPGGELYSVVYAVDDGPLPSPKRQCVRSSKEEEVRPMSPVHTPRKLRRGSTDSSALVIDASGRAALRDVMTGALREEHAAFYLGCVLLALEHLHGQALLYRDLKLENLVIDARGYPKMLDFGFAKRDDGRSSTMCGSAEYMAPEVLLHQPHDRRVDLWAFGVLAFEMLTGQTPFYHENARELGRRVVNDPVEFPVGFQDDHPLAADLIAKLLVKTPEDRVKDAKELKQHAFFATYFPSTRAWDNLLQRRHAPPFVPKLSGPFDASFFRTLDERELQALDDDVLPFDGDDGGVFAEF